MSSRSTAQEKFWRSAGILLTAIFACWILAPYAFTQDRLSANRYKSGPATKRAFRDVIADAQRGMVQIFQKDKEHPLALGAIMNEDGEILSKASELRGELECELFDGRRFAAEIIATHHDSDLALLKIDATDLSAVDWDLGPRPEVGQWFVTPGLEELPLSVGIVSVAEYTIPPDKGVLGISIKNEESGARITRVFDDSGAAKAGLKVGDIVTRVADQHVKTGEALTARISRLRPGDSLKLFILRDEKEVEILATLGYPQQDMTNLEERRGNFQNRLGGSLSIRRAGFASIIQHDSVLAPEDCGGPVVGLSGKALGLNIARGGRTESYALPAKAVVEIYKNLRADVLATQKTAAEN
jgi:serine protease Do